jgi:hypothetical protein
LREEQEADMRVWVRLALTVPAAALCLSTCVPVRYTAASKHVVVVSETAVVVDLSLGLFLNLASRLVLEPAAAPRLLQTDPKDPSDNLRSLGIDFESFRQRLAEEAKVRPMILFVPHGADLVAAARSRDLEVDSWPPLAPPAVLSGPEVDALIVFESLTGEPGGTAGRGAVALARIASLSGLASLALTREQRAKELDPKLYRVSPREWKKSALFEHTRCTSARAQTLVTKLTYQGGSSEILTTALTDKSWGPCSLVSGPGLRAVTVKQEPKLKKPKRPVIIAASYLQDPQPGPLLSDWVGVK